MYVLTFDGDDDDDDDDTGQDDPPLFCMNIFVSFLN